MVARFGCFVSLFLLCFYFLFFFKLTIISVHESRWLTELEHMWLWKDTDMLSGQNKEHGLEAGAHSWGVGLIASQVALVWKKGHDGQPAESNVPSSMAWEDVKLKQWSPNFASCFNSLSTIELQQLTDESQSCCRAQMRVFCKHFQ